MKNLICSILTITSISMTVLVGTGCATDTQAKTETVTTPKKEVKKGPTLEEATFVETSKMLLEAIKDKNDYTKIQNKLATVAPDVLDQELNSDDKKLAFWVNIYNAYIQTILTENPDLYNDRGDFFKANQVKIAGIDMSFDDIEHGIIRSTTLKLSKGYVGNPFPEGFEKKFKVKDKDPRIHFVLNCGAKDCPPVYTYDPATLDQDFDKVAKAYLKKVSEYDASKKVVKTTPLFNWFTGDWGGKGGVKDMLSKYGIIPTDNDGIDVDYIDYDWTLATGNLGGKV